MGGGGPIGPPRSGDCISPADRALVRQLVDDYHRQFGGPSVIAGPAIPPKLTFFPLAGRLWKDLFVFNYVDLDATAGFQAWDCSDFTYDGHNGNDTVLRSFGEQFVGVPVFAAQDGVVIATHDGEDDMNTVWAGQPANFVIVDHGSGREGWYFHLKKNSVAVSPSDVVSAGHQLGLCASSGVSTGPHLHFELRDSGTPYEPFAGPCRAGESGWVAQPPTTLMPYLHDFGITQEDISTYGPWPAVWPRTGQFAFTDGFIRVWWYGTDLPAGSTYKVQFKRPNGTLVTPAATQSFSNPYWRWYNWWWTYNPADLHSITGTWQVLLTINGVLVLETPLEVFATRDPGFNRPPEPISVQLDPLDPEPGDVLACRVSTSLTLDDRDYDIVRYEYVWTVNGQEVRHVTTAAHSDVLARSFVTNFAQVQCSVTPGDGVDVGATRFAGATVHEVVIPTMSGWGVGIAGLLTLIAGTVLAGARELRS